MNPMHVINTINKKKNVEFCRICLAVDVRLNKLSGSPVQGLFENITNTKVGRTSEASVDQRRTTAFSGRSQEFVTDMVKGKENCVVIYQQPTNIEEDINPHFACYMCYHQLQKCQQLVTKSQKAEELLKEVSENGGEITMKSISMIDRMTTGLNAMTVGEVLSVNIEDQNYQLLPETVIKQENIAVKEEPEEIDDDTTGLLTEELQLEDPLEDPLEDSKLNYSMIPWQCQLEAYEGDKKCHHPLITDPVRDDTCRNCTGRSPSPLELNQQMMTWENHLVNGDETMKPCTQSPKEYGKSERPGAKKIPLTNAERQRKYRLNKKRKQNCEALDSCLTSKEKNAERSKRYRDRLQSKKQCELDFVSEKHPQPTILIQNGEITDPHTNREEFYQFGMQKNGIQPSMNGVQEVMTSRLQGSLEETECLLPNAALLHETNIVCDANSHQNGPIMLLLKGDRSKISSTQDVPIMLPANCHQNGKIILLLKKEIRQI